MTERHVTDVTDEPTVAERVASWIDVARDRARKAARSAESSARVVRSLAKLLESVGDAMRGHK